MDAVKSFMTNSGKAAAWADKQNVHLKIIANTVSSSVQINVFSTLLFFSIDFQQVVSI